VLAKLTGTDLSNEGFRWLSGQEISVAGIKLRALRVSYAGELGWELHPAMEDLAALYQAVWDAGQEFGIANYGLYAANTMRMEKGYKAWGSELTNALTMIEADMPRFIQFKKDDFTGKQATLDAPVRFKIVYGEVDAGNVDPRGTEPCLVGDECIGLVTSGGYGHRVGKSLFSPASQSNMLSRDRASRSNCRANGARPSCWPIRPMIPPTPSRRPERNGRPSEPRPRGHRWRRGDRHFDRLSPDQTWLAGCCAVRAQAADLRHYLARRRAGRAAATLDQHDPARQVHWRAISRA
jgi:hypothetical protein